MCDVKTGNVLTLIVPLFQRNQSVYTASFWYMDCNNINFKPNGIECPLNSLIYDVSAMDADSILDGILQWLKLQLSWLTVEHYYCLLQCNI